MIYRIGRSTRAKNRVHIFSICAILPRMATASRWRVLKERAQDYARCADFLSSEECSNYSGSNAPEWQNAQEQSHFSVELAMKAAIEKGGYDTAPTSGGAGHDLKSIAKKRVKLDGYPKSLHKAAQSDRSVRENFTIFMGLTEAWMMHHRYEKFELTESKKQEYEENIDVYEAVFEWIMRKFVT